MRRKSRQQGSQDRQELFSSWAPHLYLGRLGASPPSAYPATAFRRRSLFRAGCNFVRPFAFPESFLVTKRPLTAPIIERCHDFGTASPDSRVLGRYSLRPTSSWSSRSPLPSGKCCDRWNSRHGEASNPHFRPMPPKCSDRKETSQKVGGPRGDLGPFRARWIVEWPCTSAALLPRQRS